MSELSSSGGYIDRVRAWSRSMYPKFSYLFELDPRSLALFRVVFGALCIADLWYRLPYLQMMYASSGWLPSHRVLWYVSTKGQENPHGWSLLYLFNTTPMITAFFIGSMVSAFCFMVGYKTRFFQILTALCMISVHTRNTVLHNGGDTVHNLWWMWTIWLPLGQRWSVDALLKSWRDPDPDDASLNRTRARTINPHVTLVTLGILVNLSLCYYLNGVHKNSADWLSGDAVPYVFEQDRILRWVGAVSREYMPLWLMRILTWVTLVFESSAPLFLLIPMASRKLNLLTLFIGVLVTHQMLSASPVLMSLIVSATFALAWVTVKRSETLTPIAHSIFSWVAVTSVFLFAFPFWLAATIGVTYTLIAGLIWSKSLSLEAESRQLWMQRVSLFVLAGFHVNATLTMQLGFFSYWMLSIYLVLVHPRDWELIAQLFKPRAPKLTLYYDSDCGVCHAFARLCARLDLYRLITWVGRSEPEQLPGGLTLEQFNETREVTLIAALTDQHESMWLHHQAVAQTLRRLPLLAPLGWLLILTGPLGKSAYQAFAQRRHRVSAWLGYGVCGLGSRPSGSTTASDQEQPKSLLSGSQRLAQRLSIGGRELGVLFCLVASLIICFNTNPHFRRRHQPRQTQLKSLSRAVDGKLKTSSSVFRSVYARPWRPKYVGWAKSFEVYGGFRQAWGLFTTVPKTDAWMVFEVKLRDGRVLDMRTGEPPSYEVADYRERSWGFYEGRWGLKLLRKSDRHQLFIDWVKRPVQRMRLKPEDVVDELNLYWVKDDTQKPIASGYRPPVFKEKKLVLSWSRAQSR